MNETGGSWRELIANEKTGVVRQAGADREDQWVKDFRKAAEENLYVFSKGVMGRDYLTKHFHLEVSNFLQKSPPHRKMLLLPRNHGKTSLVSHCLPIHILIQPSATNLYFPGLEGSECRILLAGEKEDRAKDNLRVISAAFAGNTLLRTLWPGRVWENPKRDARKWNDSEIIIPRQEEWPDATVHAIGVGGAITGARPNVIIKDDIISVEASNSDLVMQAAVDWHIVSRALLEEYEVESGLQSLEFVIGTHWATFDVYTYVKERDPTVEILTKSMFWTDEGGERHILWPERYTWEDIDQLKSEYGRMFWLLFMNDPFDPSITDFDLEKVRKYSLKGDKLTFYEDSRDEKLVKKAEAEDEAPPPSVGMPLNSATYESLFPEGRREYLMHKWKSYGRDGR